MNETYPTPEGFHADGIIHRSLGGSERDVFDHTNLVFGRNPVDGKAVGAYLQPPPMIFTRDGHNVWFGDTFRGRSAFLLLGGPSLTQYNLEFLKQPGVLTMSVNNAFDTHRTNLWICSDEPIRFKKKIWLDPTVTKFAPLMHAEDQIYDDVSDQLLPIKVGDCPNVWFYRRNEHFKPDQFLFEDTFNWGNTSDLGGGRSTFPIALRMLFFLGVRTVFLLGCDFYMDEDYLYHYDDGREVDIAGNNTTYELMEERFGQLKNIFDRHRFRVVNCNKDSHLKAFPFYPYNKAIDVATMEMPKEETKSGLVSLGMTQEEVTNKLEAAMDKVETVMPSQALWNEDVEETKAEMTAEHRTIEEIEADIAEHRQNIEGEDWYPKLKVMQDELRNARMATPVHSGGSNEICVIGHPSRVGGADTELDHQIRVWTAMGIKVHIIHTGMIDENLKSMRLEDRGCILHEPRDWSKCRGMHVISYCNGEFLDNIADIRQYASRISWVNCMTWLFEKEKEAHRNGYIDTFIYQTDHAREKVQQDLININPDFNWAKIRPYFHAEDFPYHGDTRPDNKFRFGRISRDDADKFNAGQFWIYETMVAPKDKYGFVLGIKDDIRVKCGGEGWKEPDWIKCFPAGGMSAQELYRHSECIIQACDTYENLPRVAFEAMASGSLLIVDNRGGWKEQIIHGETGYLCNDAREFVYYASRAAYETKERKQMIRNARDWLDFNWGIEKAKEEWGRFLGAV